MPTSTTAAKARILPRLLNLASLMFPISIDAEGETYGNMPHSNILLATGAAILSMNATRACESLRR